jgi:GR25 family glycosyltransferase involved in LPS biosynthesis
MNSHIYVINLDSSTDRLKYITNHINNEHNTTFTRFPGVNHTTLNIDEEIQHKFLTENFKITPGRVGTVCCALAHMKLWKHIYETNKLKEDNKSNDKYAIILEDDAEFIPNFRKKLKELIKAITKKNNGKNNIDYFNLCTRKPDGTKISDKIVKMTSIHDISKLDVHLDTFRIKQKNSSAVAYMINIERIPKILNLIHLSGWNMNNDLDRLVPLLANKINMYSISRNVICSWKEFKSDRRTKNKDKI